MNGVKNVVGGGGAVDADGSAIILYTIKE